MWMVAMHAKSTNVGYVDLQEWSICSMSKKINIRVSLIEGKIYKLSLKTSQQIKVTIEWTKDLNIVLNMGRATNVITTITHSLPSIHKWKAFVEQNYLGNLEWESW